MVNKFNYNDKKSNFVWKVLNFVMIKNAKAVLHRCSYKKVFCNNFSQEHPWRAASDDRLELLPEFQKKNTS